MVYMVMVYCFWGVVSFCMLLFYECKLGGFGVELDGEKVCISLLYLFLK